MLLVPLWDSRDGRQLDRDDSVAADRIRRESFRSFLQDVIVAEVAPRVDHPTGTGPIRVQFVASQLVGVIMARYIVGLSPSLRYRPNRSRRPSRPTCSATSPANYPNCPSRRPPPAAAHASSGSMSTASSTSRTESCHRFGMPCADAGCRAVGRRPAAEFPGQQDTPGCPTTSGRSWPLRETAAGARLGQGRRRRRSRLNGTAVGGHLTGSHDRAIGILAGSEDRRLGTDLLAGRTTCPQRFDQRL